jgi:hypothetical protein
MDEARKSARKVLELAPIIICVGHGRAVNVTRSPEEVDALKRKIDPASSLAAT